MYKKQQALTEKILFDYYMVSSRRENEIYSPFPFYIDKAVFEQMTYATVVLDKLVKRIIENSLGKNGESIESVEEYPLQKEIFDLSVPLYPFFWARYDAFKRRDGGIFFSEFNYDKPCAQREIAVSEIFEVQNDPNCQFKSKFLEGFKDLWREHSTKYKYEDRIPRVAVLIDPSHYEEVHLAHLYIDMLEPTGFDFIITGGENLYVEEEQVKAFGLEVDIILRQYPTEFLHEISCMKDVLSLFNTGRVLLINDPRAIIGQAKSLFEYLWSLVENDNVFLTEEEKEVIKSTIPFTRLFNASNLPEDITEKKNEYVIKAVYGRYSEEVYIGKMLDAEKWAEVIKYVSESDRPHIVQQFCPIKPERVFRFDGVAFKETEGFANFGIYLVNGKFAGTCIRWSEDYLSTDTGVWISPIGIRDTSLQTANLFMENRKKYWKEINETLAFGKGYTGGYTGNRESFSLQALILEEAQLEEIQYISEKVCGIFSKTTGLVQMNHEMLCPVIGIGGKLQELVTQSITDFFTFIGRFDWVMDTKGNLRLLEYNSETPAGLMESLYLNKQICTVSQTTLHNPNSRLEELILECLKSIIEDYGRAVPVRNVGVVSSTYYEDWYNTEIIFELAKQLPYNTIMGEVSGLKVEGEKLHLYGVPLDAVYRYYPLDWFEENPYYDGVLDAMKQKSLSINPPATLISQSKAFFALVWELMDQGFYSEEEAGIIRKYIVRTALSPKRLGREDYCIKPYFGREGQDISLSILNPYNSFEKDRNMVFQERVDIQPITVETYSTTGCTTEELFPVIGAYVVNDKFGGLYTRAGSRVTNKSAVYIPTFINA